MKTLLTRVTVVMGILAAGYVDAAPARAARGTSKPSQKAEESAACECATQKVVARGVGKDKAAALKDAYRDAVERAVGLYVDAETVADNDELVQDQVLTHSNAYIESYDELGTKELDSGLVQVRISAVVRKRELVEKLGKVLPSGKSKGYTGSLKDIHAQIVSEEKRDTDGAALLQNALQGIDPCTLLAIPSVDMQRKKVINEKVRTEADGTSIPIPDGQVVLRMLLRLKFDEEKYYNSFVPMIKPVLDQIASSSKKVKLSLLNDSEIIDMTVMDDYLNIGPEYKGKQRLMSGFQGREVLLGQEPCMSPMRVLYGGGCMMRMDQISRSLGKSMGAEDIEFSSAGYSAGLGWSRRHRQDMFSRELKRSGDSASVDDVVSAMEEADRHNRGKQTTVQLILVCGVNKAHTVWDAVFYQVDKRTAAAFMIWCNKYGSGSTENYPHSDENTASESVQYNVSYCDKGGDEVLMNKWRIPRICLMNADWGKIGHYSNNWALYISPFFGCFSEEYVQWHDALVNIDLLPEIESVKIELEN